MSLLELGPQPQNDDGTNYRRAYLAYHAMPLNSNPAKHITAYKAAHETQKQIHQAPLTLVPHNQARHLACHDTYNNSPNHNNLFIYGKDTSFF